MVAPFMPDDEKLAAVRAALPALGAGIYLNTGSVGPLPAETAAAMDEIAAWELRTGRGHPADVPETLARMDEARAAVAAILTADVGSIALTHSATDGMNLAASSLDWRPGDRVVSTRHEHGGGLGPLVTLRERSGVELVLVEPDPSGDDERTVAAFDAAIGPRTRLVSLSHVLWTTGAVLPVAQIADMARSRGALVAIDGAQSAGAIPVDVGALGADFYAVAAQKWLLGPEGMGALYCSPASLDHVRPAVGGWFSFDRLDPDGTAVRHADARRFEASGYHRPSVVGMARSCGWLSMYVGLDWIHGRGPALARRAAERLTGIPGVDVVTPLARMATLVTFRIAGWPAEIALAELGARVFAIARAVPGLDAIRISVGFFTTDEEIDRLARAVELLAAHTPETLPPKARLTVLG